MIVYSNRQARTSTTQVDPNDPPVDPYYLLFVEIWRNATIEDTRRYNHNMLMLVTETLFPHLLINIKHRNRATLDKLKGILGADVMENVLICIKRYPLERAVQDKILRESKSWTKHSRQKDDLVFRKIFFEKRNSIVNEYRNMVKNRI